MTENKRFYLDENGINDREYEFSILGEDELVDIINELADENEQLHLNYKELRYANDIYCQKIDSLKKENKQLKNHIQELQNHLKRLENENIQTYTLIKEAYNNERTQLGKSVLKQLIEAIQ